MIFFCNYAIATNITCSEKLYGSNINKKFWNWIYFTLYHLQWSRDLT